MIVSDHTREILRYQRGVRDLKARGFIQIGEHGDPLWRFQRGDWQKERIAEVAIGPDEQTVWIKIAGREGKEPWSI
jgi:hypothetical protein